MLQGRQGSLNRLSIFVAAGALALAGAAGLWFGRPTATPVPIATTAQARDSFETITVHVSGAVLRPGLVEVRSPARVADAVAAAGGVLATAALDGINLAAQISDGQQVHVPQHQVGQPAGEGYDGKVAINRADAGALEALPGVGPVLAQRIFDYREEHGPFSTVEDLLDVPGIGEGKLATLRDAVIVP